MRALSDKIEPIKMWVLAGGFILCMIIDGCSQCFPLTDFLSEYSQCQEECACDFDQDGQVGSKDLLFFLGYTSSGTPTDIIPKWNNHYNDSGAGNDGFDLYPSIQNKPYSWNEIKDECLVEWLIDDQVFYTGTDMSFNECDQDVLCSGAFLCTVRITFGDQVFERTEASLVNLSFGSFETCPPGVTIEDVNLAGIAITFTPFYPPFIYLTN